MPPIQIKSNLLQSFNPLKMTQISYKLLFGLFTLSTIGFIIANLQFNSRADEFQQWKSLNQIIYASSFENNYRRKIFQENKALIEQQNSKDSQTYKMGLNKFSAMTDEEFKQQYLFEIKVQKNLQVDYHSGEQTDAADIDWTQKGAVGPVKNQGQCAAAWVFSTIGPLQGLTKISEGTLELLSEQQLIDCASESSCSGGFPQTGFKYVKQHGICTQSEYPYKGFPQKCQKPDGTFKISGYTSITNCNNLSNAIQKGPVSVLVDATNWSRYSSGIFTNCGTSLNHAVTLVGEIQGNWKVQNSWGASWGESGYIRLGKGNTCGICNIGFLPYK